MKYYICDSCHFQFERSGECTQCPDCGKESVRESNEAELAEYVKLKEEFSK